MSQHHFVQTTLEKKSRQKKRKLFWRVFDGVKAARCLFALINESKHQTGCIPQVNPNFDTRTGVISPRCKYLLCNKRGNDTETDNYLLLWHLQNAMSLTMCNWWLFFTGPPGSKMCLCLFISLFICILFSPFFFLNNAEPELRRSRGWDRQVHYMSQEFKVILRLLCLLSGAPASLRYSNARSRIAKSSPITAPASACGALRCNVMKKSARDWGKWTLFLIPSSEAAEQISAPNNEEESS